MKNKKSLAAVIVASLMVLAGCSAVQAPVDSNGVNAGITPGEDGCTSIIVATSPEKVNLMDDFGQKFKESAEAKALDNCVTVYPLSISSGVGADVLIRDPEVWEGLDAAWQPTIWSPASSVWTDRVKAAGNQNLLSENTYFGGTPVVFGVPESMAEALGYPNTPIGYKDIASYIENPDGWGALGKPIWGSFKIAKTNPNTSTTGLSVILTQAYTAAGKVEGLTVDDVNNAADFSRGFELGAIHYGDTTGKILQRLYDNAQSGSRGSTYVSAVAVEETSLFWYNKGNPQSKIMDESEMVPPKEKLVAVYPTEGSLWSDNPATQLNSPWVTEEQKVAGAAFLKFITTKEAQEILPQYGFRPIDETVDVSKSLNNTVGLIADGPKVRLEKAEPSVVSAAIDQWAKIRKPSAVLQLIDISGSMSDPAGDGRSKLEGAIESSVSTLGTFRAGDEVGIWAFTTDVESKLGKNLLPVYDFAPMAGNAEKVASNIQDLSKAPGAGTPMYDAISTAYDYMTERAESGRINAIILLSDGDDQGSEMSLESLLVKLGESNSEGQNNPVRIFTIAYGEGADLDILSKIAAATGGQVFDATDATKIDKVFQQVMNNF